MSFEKICVVGLGYIGLPTAVMFAQHGKQVIGVDVSPRVVSTLQAGGIHIEEPGLGEVVHSVVSTGSFTAQLTPEVADAFILAVPTPTCDDHSADLSYVHAAARSLVPYLRRGNLVILESTSPPETTIGLIPILEQSGLTVGTDILLAHSPERVLPGRILIELVENDRVIGGHTPEAAEAGAELYRTFVTGEIHLTDATTAEMAKLMENTFRDVNIALANEFARVAEVVGINAHEAIRLANFHPRVNILQPGPGVGGHCIAVDPWFIVHAAPEEAELIRTAREINDAQPHRVVTMVEDAVRNLDAPVITVLGLAYKPDVDDVRESPSIEIARLLSDKGYDLRLHDGHADSLPHGLELTADLADALDGSDLVLILTNHSEYGDLAPESGELQTVRRRSVIDTRNSIDPIQWKAGGWDVRQLGVGVHPSMSSAVLQETT
jgi:UDP-N-acetyl-D-mannosaminuronic acid dehydrogenase